MVNQCRNDIFLYRLVNNRSLIQANKIESIDEIRISLRYASWLWRFQRNSKQVKASFSHQKTLTTWAQNDQWWNDRIKVWCWDWISWCNSKSWLGYMGIGWSYRWTLWGDVSATAISVLMLKEWKEFSNYIYKNDRVIFFFYFTSIVLS